MGKVYRTAQGRELDIEKIRLQHEMVPALGNMQVNARGDQLGPGGKILKTRETIMNDHYRQNSDASPNVPKDGPIPTRSPRKSDDYQEQPSKEFVPGTISEDDGQKPRGGLARAIKAAQEGKDKKGLRRL